MVETVGYGKYSLGPRITITPSGSPYIYQNTDASPQEVFISAGTIVTVEFSRDGITWDSCGLLGGQFRLNPADSIRVTYVILAPTMVAYPF